MLHLAALSQAPHVGVLLTHEWLTYYAIASDLIVLPGQGGLVIVTMQVPRSPGNEEREVPLS